MTDDPRQHPDGSFVVYAEKMVDRLVTARTKLHKTQIRVLSAAIVFLAIVSGVLGFFLAQNTALATKVQLGSVQSCQQANANRAENIQIWDSFIALLLKGNTDPKAHAEGQYFEGYIAKVDAPKNCGKLFGK